ncbi:ABC transporter permease [Actinoplanes sp. NPDC049265]|uniref:ABC transporter permease n=1 Tax=Actinoplanes sp. NPDC049265 TaxID=3363902 RepID=UPI00371F1B52
MRLPVVWRLAAGRLPVVHWPSVRGRARADVGLLLLVAVVVAVSALLAGATPALLRSTTDATIRDAVRSAGDDGAVVAHSSWDYDDALGGRQRKPDLAAEMDVFRLRAESSLDPDLRAALRPPVMTAGGPSFNVTDGSLLRTFQYSYLSDNRGAFSAGRVTWIAGGPPRGSAPADEPDLVVRSGSPPWPVQVGVTEATAAALRLKPGDRIPLKDKLLRVKIVTISGIFRPVDPADPAWRLTPWVLRPLPGLDGLGSTRLGGLLSPESLPDARLAVEQDELDRLAHFDADPAKLDSATAGPINALLVTLQATSGSFSAQDGSLQWLTQLDHVLRTVQMRVNAATAQASVLLAGVLTGAVLVLALAAALLARRRAPALTAARHRGAGLPGLATELLIESAALALVATLVGLVAARLVTPGIALWWSLPVAAAALLAGPAYGIAVAARATRDRRVPANRAARRRLRRTASLRRAAIEGAVLIVAAGAVVALRQRGILPASAGPTAGALDPFAGQESTSALAAAAPALGVIAGALVLVRLLPPVLRFLLRRALRSRRPLVVFGTAQAAGAAQALPALVMVAAAGLATFALTTGATAGRGLTDAAWRTVGADVRVDAVPSAGVDLTALARKVAAAPGVEHVATAQITEGASVAAPTKLVTTRLVVLDAAAYRRLLDDAPVPDGPAFDRLGAAHSGGAVAALVRSADGTLRPGVALQVPRKDGAAVALTAVGTAPAIGDSGDAVYVDATALAAAGVPIEPNTLWASGPGAAGVLAGAQGVRVTSRTDVARERRTTPVTAGLIALTWVSAGTLVALGLLGFALGAASGAPRRWATMGRLRTLGLRLRDTRTVAAVELLPPVLVAALAGPLLGVALAVLTFGSLALRLLVGWDSDPVLAVPWWPLVLLAVVLVTAVPVAGWAEAAARRRQGLGELLRVGE